MVVLTAHIVFCLGLNWCHSSTMSFTSSAPLFCLYANFFLSCGPNPFTSNSKYPSLSFSLSLFIILQTKSAKTDTDRVI